MKNFITQTLRRLGVTANYRGYRQLFLAIEMVAIDEDRLVHLNRDVFMPISEILHCNYKTIERNIRTLIPRIWRTNQAFLCEIAGFTLTEEPTVGDLIDYLASYVRCSCIINIM